MSCRGVEEQGSEQAKRKASEESQSQVRGRTERARADERVDAYGNRHQRRGNRPPIPRHFIAVEDPCCDDADPADRDLDQQPQLVIVRPDEPQGDARECDQ